VLARDRFIGREVALKELLPAIARPATPGSGGGREARFLREARLIAQLDHPGIVAVHELAQGADGTLFCAEKLVRGETLKAHLQGCTSLRQRLALLPHLIDASSAIAYAHSRGVIHRDLKPSNIMVGPYGETVVVDWGLAKHRGEPEVLEPTTAMPLEPTLTVAGVALGTPSYMSPEQARGAVGEIDERSDVFSLGAMLYELLCGRVPFEGDSGEEIISKALSAPILPVRTVSADVSPELAAIADRALQRAPDDRYQSAQALVRDLRAYQAGHRVRAYEYGSWELVRKFVAANRALSVVAVAAAVILVVAAAIIFHQLQVARVDLARSFIDRAKTAESISDWARAAGYYAASRIEHDSAEARWGYALAAERVSPRVSLRRGPPGAFVDVGPLADGRLITLGRRDGVLIGSDLGTGKELWRADLPEGAQNISLRPRQLVSMQSARPLNPNLPLSGRTLLDAATGKFLASLDEGIPCSRSPFPPPVLVSSAGLVTTPVQGGRPTVLSVTVERESKCIVSDDGREVAFDDARGSIHIWNLVDRKERAARYAPDVREMIFTSHGLALVRPTIIHVFGGSEGDFLVDIPRGSGTGLRPRAGGIAVSGDGHRVVLDRGSGNHADLVDLQSRTVVSSFSFLPGQPKLAFSSDGKQVFAAGLQGDSALGSWEIRAPVPRKTFEASPYMTVQPSRDGKRFVVYREDSPSSARWELYDAAGTQLLSGAFGQNPEFSLTPDGRRIVTRDDHGVTMLDADDGRVVWQIGCKDCFRLQPSADGRRLFTSSGKRLALWSVDSPDPIWTDTGRVSEITAGMDTSLDGSRIAWVNGTTVHVRTVGSSTEFETSFAEALRDLKFSADGQRLLIAGRGEIALWSLQPWKRLWSVRSPFSGPVFVEWSSDESVLLLDYYSMGNVLLEAATGHHLAMVPVSKPRAGYPEEKVLPSLKGRISLGDGRWELWSFPEPDAAPPRESLARITSATGLELVGVELVDTASAGVEGETRPPN
jgi:outer membrane protein assembly factor BamB